MLWNLVSTMVYVDIELEREWAYLGYVKVTGE